MDGINNNDQMPSKMPSNENGENQAQNPSLDSKDSKDGILQTGKETITTAEEESREEKYLREQEEIGKWNKQIDNHQEREEEV